MAHTVSDALVERLKLWGVDRIYGYPGDGINGLMGALNRSDRGIAFVQTRHEEAAAFMACGHSKFGGGVGVCLGTSGPGAIHLLTGLYDAKADHQSVVAIVGQKPRSALGGEFQQEVDLVSLFKDVAHEFVQMVTTPEQMRHVVDRAFRIAIARRTPTCIVIPQDIQELAAKEPAHKPGTIHSGAGYAVPSMLPNDRELRRAADVLNAGKRVAILIGAGATGAVDHVLAVADRLGAGIAKALLGKPLLDDTLPFVTGSIGYLGTRPSWELMQECDTLLMIGSGFPYSEFLPEEGHARGVQIDIDPRMLSLRYPMEVNLEGDAAATLAALLPLLDHQNDRGWREQIQRNVAQWWQTLERRAMEEATPVNPQRVFWELSSRLPDGALLACDTGTSAHWYARDIKIRPGMRAAHSGSLASMGAAVPYAIAAKFLHPHRPAFCFVGDGAMQMNAMNELITLAKYWASWTDPRFVLVVLNNGDLSMVTWEQRILEGDPKYEASQNLPGFSYVEYAQLLGFGGYRVARSDQIAAGLDAALSSDRPFVLEVLSDPEVPPLPPHISLSDAKHYLAALVKGDPNAARIVRAAIKEWFA